MRDTYI